LHQLVAGSLPFDAETIAGMFVAVAYDEPKMLTGAEVPFELSRIVKACLAKQPSERPSVPELSELLAPFAPADSMAPQLAMTIEDEPVPSIEIVEPSPVSRMKAAFEKTMSGPPPLPRSRLGAMPRLPVDRLGREIRRRFGRGWLAARLLAQSIAPEAHTPADRSFQRRRWGAVGVVAAAAVLGIASLFASPEPTAAAATELAAEPVQLADAPLEFGLSAFVPPSFALQVKDDSETQSDRASTPPAVLPVRWTPPAHRSRLIVHDDPYRSAKQTAAGFTHPNRLQDRRR
jgi:hypothetical protein